MEVFGISMAVIEEVTLIGGNFANARTFPVSGMPVPTRYGCFS
jgi:hypothetical protein